jgi:hypothetical protein
MCAHTRLLVTTLLAAGFLGASGCSSGGGSAPAPVVTGNEPGTAGNEPTGGGGGFESPGSAAVGEPPGSTSVNDPPGGGSGSSSGGGSGQSNCVACVTYDCTWTINATNTESFTAPLLSSAGGCVFGEFGGVTLACGGAVLEGGIAVGAWTSSGAGFTASATNVGSITCTVSASTGTGEDAG